MEGGTRYLACGRCHAPVPVDRLMFVVNDLWCPPCMGPFARALRELHRMPSSPPEASI